MGLDMYLYGIKSEFNAHDYNIGHVKTSTEIGYWRKANQIHNWFVENVQRGVDNCATYYVDKKDLEKLKETCEKVLKNPKLADKELPTHAGFFFGSYEYDEYYFMDLRETIDIINWALSKNFDHFEYQSSW